VRTNYYGVPYYLQCVRTDFTFTSESRPEDGIKKDRNMLP